MSYAEEDACQRRTFASLFLYTHLPSYHHAHNEGRPIKWMPEILPRHPI
jgi:hypothetical protein